MRTSQKIEQVCASMFAVHRDLELPKTNAKGQARGAKDYRYLDLPALIEHLKPLLTKYQLFVTQEDREAVGGVRVFTTVWHISGQFLEFGPAFIAVTGDEQRQGAAKTYCRRYALAAAFDLAADKDTDAADKRGPSVREAVPTRQADHDQEAAAGPSMGEGAGSVAASLLDMPDAPATSEQVQNLFRISGSDVRANNRLTKYAHTTYTKDTWRKNATGREVALAILAEEIA
jgi:hypothetical protein